MIVISDDSNSVFGAFCNETLQTHSGFYGDGSCFLWKKQESHFKFFPATGQNTYFVYTEPHCIAFGGGYSFSLFITRSGKFGLWIDEALDHGHSTSCQTFMNEPLSKESEFRIQNMEIWSFHI